MKDGLFKYRATFSQPALWRKRTSQKTNKYTAMHLLLVSEPKRGKGDRTRWNKRPLQSMDMGAIWLIREINQFVWAGQILTRP